MSWWFRPFLLLVSELWTISASCVLLLFCDLCSSLLSLFWWQKRPWSGYTPTSFKSSFIHLIRYLVSGVRMYLKTRKLCRSFSYFPFVIKQPLLQIVKSLRDWCHTLPGNNAWILRWRKTFKKHRHDHAVAKTRIPKVLQLTNNGLNFSLELCKSTRFKYLQRKVSN